MSACTNMQGWPILFSAEMKSLLWAMTNMVNLLILSQVQDTSQMDSKIQKAVYFNKKTYV